jgi:hypothetical protein
MSSRGEHSAPLRCRFDGPAFEFLFYGSEGLAEQESYLGVVNSVSALTMTGHQLVAPKIPDPRRTFRTHTERLGGDARDRCCSEPRAL